MFPLHTTSSEPSIWYYTFKSVDESDTDKATDMLFPPFTSSSRMVSRSLELISSEDRITTGSDDGDGVRGPDVDVISL